MFSTDDHTRTATRPLPQLSPAATMDSRVARLSRGDDGALRLWCNGEHVRVRPVRCFPWSAPDEHISLRGDNERELAFVANVAALDPESRRALQTALEETGTMLTVTEVISVEEEFELRTWKVTTRRGARTFLTALETWPRRLPTGGTVIQDVAGDLYWIPDARLLDRRSQRALWAYVT